MQLNNSIQVGGKRVRKDKKRLKKYLKQVNIKYYLQFMSIL